MLFDKLTHWILSRGQFNPVDSEETSMLELIGRVVTKCNDLIGDHNNISNKVDTFDKAKVNVTDLENNRKLGPTGDFKGTWFGVPFGSADPQLASEVRAARKGEQTLSDKMARVDAEISKIHPVEIAVASKRDSALPIMMADLGADVKTAMTGGSVAVVGLTSIGSENLKPNAVKPANFLNASFGKNLFDKNDITPGYYIATATGLITQGISTTGLDTMTGFILILPNTHYIRSHVSNAVFYDANLNFISGESPNYYPFTSPANAKYVRLSVKSTDLNSYQLELGDTKTAYEPFKFSISGLDPGLNDISGRVDSLEMGINKNIPDYFQTEILDTVEKVENLTSTPSLVFTILADSHSDALADQYSYIRQSARNIAEVNKNIQSNAIIHLGDFIAGSNTWANSKATIREVLTDLRQTNRPVFALHGNHDDNSYGTDKSISNIISASEFYSTAGRQTDIYDNVHRNGNVNYFYADYPKQKIRLIMLDAVDYPYQEDSNGGLVHNGQNWWGYSWPQVEWFANIALKVDAGWGVLVCSHTPTRASHSLTGRMVPYSSDAIEGILKAFKAGTPFNPFDFTAQGKRDVIGFIAGHAHFDFAEIPADLGFPCINIACNEPSQIDNSLIPTGGLNPSRLIGTVTQDLWDVLVLRQDERKLHLIRFGAGNDVELSY